MEANGIGLPAVFLDGAIGLEFGASSAFHKQAFSPALAAEVLEILDELGVEPVHQRGRLRVATSCSASTL